MSGFKLKPPDNAIFGRREPRNVFYDAHALDQLLAHHGWIGLPSTGTPKAVTARIAAIEEQSLRTLIGYLSQAASKDPNASLNPYVAMLAESIPEDFAQKLADDLSGTPILSDRTNIVTGEPVEIGKIHAAGRVTFEEPAGLVTGIRLPLSSGLRYIGLSKRLKFNAINDVQVAIAVDHKAFFEGSYGLIFTGAEITVPVKIRGLSDGKLSITGGRDRSGAAAFSFGLLVPFLGLRAARQSR